MLVLCLTVIGLIKSYTRFEKITTLADNFLAFVSIRIPGRHGSFSFGYTREEKLAADETRPPSGFALLVSLTLTAAVAMFMTFAPAG